MNLRTVFESPDLFLLGFDGAEAVFAQMDRDAYHRSIFCDRRISPAREQQVRVATSDLIAARPDHAGAAAEIGYIFHMAHCGSTLLARALDVKHADLVIREPMALRQVAVDSVAGGADADWRGRFDLVTTLLARRYSANAPVIVKGNVPINFIASALMGARAQRAILLYFPLEHYLTAILRSPNHRAWIGNVMSEVGGVVATITGAPVETAPPLAAAQLWLAQIALYADLLTAHPQTLSLNAEHLFNAPRDAVGAAFATFGVAQTTAEIDAIVASDLFTHSAKKPDLAFDNAARLARRERLTRELSGEIAAARTWVAARTASGWLPEKLGNPLSGDAPALLASA